VPTRQKTSQPSKQATGKPAGRPSAHAGGIDPIAMLKEDHTKVKGLFDDFEAARTARSKQRIARDALIELDIHAGIEEEIFYPAFHAESEEEQTEEIVLEAEEEHHVVHLLIAELKEMLGSDDPRFDAKFTVLAENVRHHIKEEEKEMLPKARKLGKERLMELGAQMMERRQELKRQFKDGMAQAS
jgi:hemerythrin-like domain-containing protein